jgi:hypothetical protein
MGKGTPITPVLATRTFFIDNPSLSAANLVISTASAIPESPVHALAQPELTTTAWAFWSFKCFFERITGADLIELAVKTAAATHGFSEHRIAKSSLLGLFILASTAPARKPCGEVTVPEVIALNSAPINEGIIIALFVVYG